MADHTQTAFGTLMFSQRPDAGYLSLLFHCTSKFQHTNTADITKTDNKPRQAHQGSDPSLTCINMPVALACVESLERMAC
jgi:hypothetical protein